jgi:deoxyribose-phosphate aldolase
MCDSMELQEILAKVDHTLLRTDASWEEIAQVVEEGAAFGTASVCIPPCFVRQAAKQAAGRVKICTVIGFPNGYASTESKVYEAWDAVRAGADEVDMVINLGWVKGKRYGDILREINQVKSACGGKILKVIVETCLLTQEEKLALCQTVSESRAEFIKTSTGFSKGGATFADVKLLRENCSPDTLVKAAGGISTLADAEEFINLGAARLGTSRIVKLAKELQGKDGAES